MIVTKFEDSDEFSKRFSPAWLDREAECGVIYRIAKANIPGMHYYAVTSENEASALTACLQPADQIVITGTEPVAAEFFASYLVDEKLEVPGIFAPKGIANAFAKSYAEKTGEDFKLVKSLGHYGLTELGFTPVPLGHVRLATLEESQLLIQYRTDSQSEGNTQRPVDPTATIEGEIAARALYVLELQPGKIVSTGAIHWDRSPNSAYVDHIYTPPDHRGNGYATQLVYALSEIILAENLVARLSVDLENLPAIAVYEKLGYKMECQMNNLRKVANQE